MENRGLLFIPDISGFTRFVNQTEIEHSRLIIQELLEILIGSNQIGLQVSEIEGDAILFYKFGDAPSLEAIYRQVERMFCEFHKSIIAYDHRRYCQCKACNKAAGLTLKVITHYGEFAGYSVQHFHKLIGKDIIIAHQLLKNDIDEHEYWLVTKDLMPAEHPDGLTEWMQWSSSAKQTESGEVAYHFTQLGPLKDSIEPDAAHPLDLSKKIKMVSATHDYHTDFITLFHACGDFSNRAGWMEGVEKVEQLNHFLPRVGMKFRRIAGGATTIVYSSSYVFRNDHIEFSETEEGNGNVMYFTIDKLEDRESRLTVDYYINRSFPAPQLFALLKKKKVEQQLKISLENMVELLKTLPDFSVEEFLSK